MKKLLLGVATLLILATSAFAQCEGWGTPQDSMKTVRNHVLYRDYVKNAKGTLQEIADAYTEALPFWKYCYKHAPAGNAKHFIDGIKIYKAFYKVEKDEAKKAEHLAKINELYDRRIECFGKEGYILGRKMQDLYYYLGGTPEEILALGKKVIEMEGNKVEPTVLVPYARSAMLLFREDKISQEEVLQIQQVVNKIADTNIANPTAPKEVARFQKAKEQVAEQFAAIEDTYDCSHYRQKIVELYNTDPNNPEVYIPVRDELIRRRCGENDPLIVEIQAKIKAKNAAIIAGRKEREEKFKEQNAPTANEAIKLYKAGQFSEAISLYEKAISETNVAEKQATYNYRIASCYQNMKQYSKVRTSAKKALSLNPGMGKAYLLIGKAYMSGSCGSNDWGKPLCYIAAVEKFRQAKSIDPSVSGEADKLISKYGGQCPTTAAAHERLKKDGDRVSTGCWIGETVTLKTKKQY